MEFLTDPWTWWIEPFTANVFMQRALLAGLLAVVATSVVGTWVVLRGMTFLGDALAHGVLPGIALAVVIGVSPTLGALVAAAVMVGGVHVVRRHSPLPEDASIGLLFVGMLALAVVIVSAGATADVGDLHRVLFGSVTGLETADLWRQAVAAAIAVVGAFAFHRAFLVLTFDETQAALLGLRPRLTHLVLMGLVAMSVVASFEAVGSLLVFAFLVAPPATAVLVVRRIPLVMATAVGVGSVAVVLGALISYHHDTAAGATMALVAVLFCFAVMGVQGLREAPQPAR
ncbi:MAG TPA: metal ABC transporter permease [Acidimicrobiales bacterium]|nr:metal ABC transporter permease [Acidimicrobiales bacterium]MDP6240705.1 metal ABC transporter permease [Acidimicrobiales bacterium]MDP7123701.1 metal ABC transporter permease [Acidimicrobiales bacterium]MDP7352206.1 metal ABC transporter permease [Acidimicrobiales bacterium]MDP7508161.1 metal ABC transporter permease [Acidimicrobiales bacterium]